jgi:dUTPase
MTSTKRKLTIWLDKGLLGSHADELYARYTDAADKHNENVLKTGFPDAGFDIIAPPNVISASRVAPSPAAGVTACTQVKLLSGIRCSMEELICSGSDNGTKPLSFYMYPRSSLSKTPLRLSNSVGIIDSGYRGQLMAMFDVNMDIASGQYEVEPYTRLCQICCGDLEPFTVKVEMLEAGDVDNLVNSTKRGEGGFGSTG